MPSAPYSGESPAENAGLQRFKIIENLKHLSTANPLTENGALMVGNAAHKFRDGFVNAAPDTAIWDQYWNNQGGTFVNGGGNSSGSSYLRISLDPLTADSEYILESKQLFQMPSRMIAGISASQRILGQEVEFSFVGVNDNGDTDYSVPATVEAEISGNVSIASNVATINFLVAHPFKGGDRVIVRGCQEKRLNVGPVQVTVVTATQITVPCTLTNGSYAAAGIVSQVSPCDFAKNAFGMIFENTSATQASFFTRRNGSSTRYTPAQTISTLTGSQTNTSPYTDAWNSASLQELLINMHEGMCVSKSSDSTTAAGTNFRFSQSLPDEEIDYKLRFRVKNLANLSRPVAKISSASKSGSTTATITTLAPHGLTVGDFIQIYGILDQTNFANLTTSTAVATVIDANNFTIAFGASATSTSSGGFVVLNNGSVALPGAINLAIASVARVNNILTVTMNTTATGLVAGEYCNLYGMTGSAAAYEGAYKVLRQTGTTYELESVGVDFGSIATGGGVIKRTDVRLHFVSELEYARHLVEIFNQNGSADAQRAVSVNVANTPTVTASNLSTNLAQVGGTNTVNGGVAGILAVGGNIAHSTAATANPIPIGGRVQSTLDTSLTNNDTSFLAVTTAQQLYVKSFGTSENDWQYAPPSGGIVNSTAGVTIRTAGAASIRNYATAVDLSWDALTNATEFCIRDGASGTVLYRHKIPSGASGRFSQTFPTPIRGSAATLMEIATITASGAGGVFANIQGYQSF